MQEAQSLEDFWKQDPSRLEAQALLLRQLPFKSIANLPSASVQGEVLPLLWTYAEALMAFPVQDCAQWLGAVTQLFEV